MWLNFLQILLACVEGVVLGLIVYWIIIRVQKRQRPNQPNSIEGERPTPSTITEDNDDRSLEQPLKEADYAVDIKEKTEAKKPDADWMKSGISGAMERDLKKEDDDWLFNAISGASDRDLKKEDDDWLTAGIEDVPTNISELDDWLKTENKQALESPDETSLNYDATNPPEIKIKTDGSVINITVTTSSKQGTNPQQTVVNLSIKVSSQNPNQEEMDPFNVEIIIPERLTARDLQEAGTIQPSDSLDTFGSSLMDEITVKPMESQVIESHAFIDELTIRPVESQVIESHALMDEITVKPVDSPVIESPQLIDEISIRPVESQVTESHALMDEISIKPSPGPVIIEYELLDDLITKSALYRTKKEKPSSDAVVTNPVERPVEKAEPVQSISVNEIAEVLREKRNFKQATITSAATRTRKSSILGIDIPIIATPFKVILLSLIYLAAMAIAELIVYRIYPVGGIVIYFIILFSLIINGISAKDQSQRDFYIALGLAPLIRIILLSVPGILVFSQYLWYIVASIPIIAGIISISRIMNLSLNDVGLNFNKPLIQFLVAITGIGLAMVDYLILKPAAWTSMLTIQEALIPAFVLLIFTGLIEELSFRGVMQRASVALGSYGWIFIAAVYGVLQIWQGSVLHCVFAFGVSLFFGWIVKKTGSILGVSAAHGFINIGLFLVLPHIF